MDYNWLDLGVFAVLAVFLLIGLSSGLVFSAFRIVSMLISLFMSLSFYGKLTALIRGTLVEDIIRNLIYGGLRAHAGISAAQRDLDVEGVREGVAAALRLPKNVADAILARPGSISDVPRTSLFDEIDIIRHFSDECASAVISLVAVVAVYCAIRIAISILKIFLDEIAALKLFRLFNYITGPVLGIVEGLAVIYIALSVIMAANIVAQQDIVYSLVEDSKIARTLYENNMFLDFALKRIVL
ncbi:MAG: CvpA family protein [Clostridiales bacterium]|jgi:uncharacterized membrane protein required for colicin V production|nr:CvpA family protein [Clostridiales bacterium]